MPVKWVQRSPVAPVVAGVTRRDTGSTPSYGRRVRANVGVPDLKVITDSDDKKTRWVELKIPITEGPRYKVGTFEMAGNTVAKAEALRRIFARVTLWWVPTWHPASNYRRKGAFREPKGRYSYSLDLERARQCIWVVLKRNNPLHRRCVGIN